jgi:hypothetical protein
MIRIPYSRVEYEGFVIKGLSRVISTFDELEQSYQSRDEIASDLMN